MLKFLIGVLVGAVLVVIVAVIGLVALASLRNRPPAIASGSTLVLHLEGTLPERAPVEIPFAAFGQRTSLSMVEVWSSLRRAAADKRIEAVVLEPANLQVGWGKMQELRMEIEQFRKSGKPLFAYLKTPGTREYYVAAGASQVYLAPEDMLNLKGLRFELMYFKRTLDKLGVSIDVEHDGKYKDYGDMFTRTSMSPESREVYTSIIDRLYADLIKTIGTSRHKSAAEVQDAIDNGPLLSPQVLSRGLVDELCFEDQMFGKVKTAIHDEVRKIGEKEYARSSDSSAGITGKQKIALIAAEGTIVRGDAQSESSTDGIEAESFNKMLVRVENDPGLKGVIVRIDSPGGEVFASDAIWHEMNNLARKKPVVISMSDAAASGGYYMAMNRTPIVAYPGTITGSIGVVFGKANLHGLYDKIGVDKDTLSRGRFAEIDSDNKPLDGEERAKLRAGIDQNYQTFLRKVAASRNRKVEEIEPLAQGRVWLGEQAKENGLVDELGGIDRAIQLVKQRASIPAGDAVTLVTYPPRRSLFQLLFSSPSPDASITGKIEMAISLRHPEWVAPVLRDSRMLLWLRGGFLSVSPAQLAFQ